MAEHTPGPWTVCGGYTPAYTTIHSEAGYIVFRMADATDDREHGKPIEAPDMEAQRANARLIAAAPDLLEACQAVKAQFDYLRGLWGDEAVTRRVCEQLETAIANATGGNDADR